MTEKSSRALGEAIRAARISANLVQEDLAALVNIGTSTLQLIESGRANGTSIFTVLRILAATSSPLEALDETYKTLETSYSGATSNERNPERGPRSRQPRLRTFAQNSSNHP